MLVAGVSGSGKATLARRIGVALDLLVTEMGALHHGPSWAPRPEFMADVEAFSSADAWVCEWQYPDAWPLLVRRATRSPGSTVPCRHSRSSAWAVARRSIDGSGNWRRG
ncbi:MAG: hypothetical protein ACR2FE_00780 [Aeromicrobium sp.]